MSHTCSPTARQVAELRAAATPQDIQDVMAALLVQAKKGNVAAARLFLAYTVGKPAGHGRAAMIDDPQATAVAIDDQPDEAPERLTNSTTRLAEAGLSAGPLRSPTHPNRPEQPCPEPGLDGGPLNGRQRAQFRKAERRRRKAERKQARTLALQAARPGSQRLNGPARVNSARHAGCLPPPERSPQ
jgi:hypothetical protein